MTPPHLMTPPQGSATSQNLNVPRGTLSGGWGLLHPLPAPRIARLSCAQSRANDSPGDGQQV